jgi:hypothetical protein
MLWWSRRSAAPHRRRQTPSHACHVSSSARNHGGAYPHDRRDLRAGGDSREVDDLDRPRMTLDGDLVAELDRPRRERHAEIAPGEVVYGNPGQHRLVTRQVVSAGSTRARRPPGSAPGTRLWHPTLPQHLSPLQLCEPKELDGSLELGPADLEVLNAVTHRLRGRRRAPAPRHRVDVDRRAPRRRARRGCHRGDGPRRKRQRGRGEPAPAGPGRLEIRFEGPELSIRAALG